MYIPACTMNANVTSNMVYIAKYLYEGSRYNNYGTKLNTYVEWSSPHSPYSLFIVDNHQRLELLSCSTIIVHRVPNAHAHTNTGKGRQHHMRSSNHPRNIMPVSFCVATVVALLLLTEVHSRVAPLRQGHQTRAFLVSRPRWLSTGWIICKCRTSYY